MNMAVTWQTLTVIVLAFGFAYLNGVLDSGSLVATAIASRSLSSRWALALASLAELAGPFLFGTAVATTIGTGLVQPATVSVLLVGSALLGALVWNVFSAFAGLPTSSSHALVGGLVGAALAAGGTQALQAAGLLRILLALVVGPLAGLALGYLGLRLLLVALRVATPVVNYWFKRAQTVTLIVLALSHGTNDAQKTMGMLLLVLAASGVSTGGQVPLWVVAFSAAGLALGIALGGSRTLRTVGSGFYKIRPVHGFSAQTAAALVILGGTALGAPLSTGQVMSSAIIGVGAAHRLSAVRWELARNVVIAWLVTMPVSGTLAGGMYWLLSR
ncbi:MAG: inorganic phosphate transporter [Chloroflexi bacterium]|nr:inorganic phosphate transporter [Chloroflexota bacterium]